MKSRAQSFARTTEPRREATRSPTLEPTAAAHPWKIVALLWLAYFLNYIDRQAVFSIFPVLERELGFSSVELGLVGSIFIWVYSLTTPFAGRLADRTRRRERLIAVSLVLWSAATLATGLSGSVASFLFWRGMVGLTEGLYFPAAVSALGAVHASGTRSRAIALHGSAQFAGIAAGGWFGGWMAETWGWRIGLAILALAGVAYAPLLRFGLGALPAPPARAAASSTRPRHALASSCFWALAAAFFLLCILLWMLYAWLPSFIYERYGLGLAESGFVATLFLQAGSAVGIVCGGALGDWTGRRVGAGRFYVAAAGLFACAPFAHATVATHSLLAVKVSAAAFGFCAAFMMSNLIASAYDVIEPAHHGFGAGALTTIGGVGGGLAIYSVGRWKETLGVASLMAWGSAAAMIAAVVLAVVVARRFGADRERAGVRLYE